MTSITNRWKLGLFVVAAAVLGVAVLMWLGASQLQREVEIYYVFFDEDVSGLEVGSPVKFRGVAVGSVAEIAIAEDRRTVKVTLEVFTSIMRRIGLRHPGVQVDELREQAIALGLRAQLASSGITGNKFVAVDYFDLEHRETLTFDFDLPPRTLLSVASTVKSLEATLYAVGEIPEIFDEASEAIMGIQQFTANMDARLAGLELEGLLDSLRTQVDGLDTARLSARLDEAIVSAHAVIDRAGGTMAGLDADRERVLAVFDRAGELVTTLEQAVNEAEAGSTAGSIREAAQAFTSLSDETDTLLAEASAASRDASILLEELRGSVRTLEDTMAAIRDLADLLERDPGALLRGREETATTTRAP